MKYPTDLKYTKEHEWVKIDGGTATVGITAHAQEALGDIVFVDLPKVGRELKAGETFGVVESIKAVSDLYSPLAGKITEVNSSLADKLDLLSSDPHGKGWLIKMSASNPATSNLMDATAYEKYVSSLA